MKALKQEIKNLIIHSVAMYDFNSSADSITNEIMKAIELRTVKNELEIKFIAPNETEVINYILASQLMETHTIDQIKNTASNFFNYYDTKKWKIGSGKKMKNMVNWKKALTDWTKRNWDNSNQDEPKINESVKAYLQLQKIK
jgi:hypothetical protein